MEPKKWYQSKIVLFSASTLLLVGGDLLTGFLTASEVTPEQLAAIEQAGPQVVEAVHDIKAGENVFQTIASIFPAIILILRVWFTATPIAPIVPKKN
jgi:hypothetical protein